MIPKVHESGERYDLKEEILAVKKQPYPDFHKANTKANQTNEIHSDFVQYSNNEIYKEGGVSVIILVLIIIGVIVLCLVIIGITYNYIKKIRQGRHCISAANLKKGTSFTERDQSEDKQKSENDTTTQKDNENDTGSLKNY